MQQYFYRTETPKIKHAETARLIQKKILELLDVLSAPVFFSIHSVQNTALLTAKY